MVKTPNSIVRFTLILFVIWSVMVGVSLVLADRQERVQVKLLAIEAARANFNKDQAFRFWASSHGGVYVFPDERTPPSPYLSHIPNRDIITRDGELLTLMNPAYMLRQMMEDYDRLYGIKGKITGKVLLNPINTPDEWELKALDLLEQGQDEVMEMTEIDGSPYLRLMSPMYMRESCMKCHGHLGFKVGDLRGGVDIAVPMASYLLIMKKKLVNVYLSHGIVWLIVSLGMGYAGRKAWVRNQERKVMMDDLELSDEVFHSVTSALLITDDEERILRVNPAFTRITGYAQDEVLGKTPRILSSGKHDTGFYKKLWDTLVARGYWHGEITNRQKDGNLFISLQAINAVTNKDGRVIRYVAAFEDITQRKQVEMELQSYREHLEDKVEEQTASIKAIVQTAADGIITINDRGVILTFNPFAEKMFGYTADEVIGKNVNMLMGTPNKEAHTANIRRYLETGVSRVVGSGRETEGRRKDGTVFPIYLAVTEMTIEKEKRFTGILRDITRDKENQKALLKAKDAAETANRAKSAFLANMSHEIRTPMNSVIGFIDLSLENSGLQPALRKYLTTARNSSKTLLFLINDILDLSKLEAGKLDIENQPFLLPVLLKNVLRTLMFTAKEKALNLTLEIHPSLYICIESDRNRLRQILVNLIGNAIKFTNKGHVKVYVKAHKDAFMLFSVEDTGIGMTAGQAQKVFHPFSQADESTARRFGGTGLGTTISKELVDLMGGEIWVESIEGRGSTFYFTLPLVPAECREECDPECMEHEGPGELVLPKSPRCFNILMAEDIEENVTLAGIRLRQQCHEVDVAGNGAEAVAMFRKEAYDVILMDVHMPEMDGLEASRKIRRIESASGQDIRIPIIALTASVMEKDRKACISAGMNAVVAKPIPFDELFELLEKIVPEGAGKPVTNLNVALDDGDEWMLPDEHDGLDIDTGLTTWQNKTAYINALKNFADRYEGAARAMEELIGKGSVTAAYELAHALKGVAGNLSVVRVANLAVQVDLALIQESPEEAMQMLPELNRAIGEAVSQIRKIQTPKESPAKAPEDIDLNRMGDRIRQLETLFRRGEVNDRLASELIRGLTGRVPAAVLDRLRDSIETYQLEEASDILNTISLDKDIK
ncbi:MAG: PAS domain S-box protein [Desulfobacterales bacterium]|nr:PAS domain S-box protein [Desulfobacterales bacterium]